MSETKASETRTRPCTGRMPSIQGLMVRCIADDDRQGWTGDTSLNPDQEA